MKKLITKILFILLIPFMSMIGYSSWIIVVDKKDNVNLNANTSSVDVCYINTDSDGNRYTSIERALQVAKSGDIVHVYLDAYTNANGVKVGKKTISNDCIIKEGVTLNIAYDTSYTVISKNSDGTVEATTTGGSLYGTTTNTVNVSEGVTITNYGLIVIGGILSGGSGGSDYAGQTYGNHGKMILGNNVTINTYGDFICCGYIEEENFENNSGINILSGTLGLPFIVRDSRGGSVTYALYSSFSTYKCNIFNQFEIINIKCKIRVNHGGSIEGYANLYILNNNAALVGLIGNSSSDFMQLEENSYVDIKYNKNTSIAQYDFYGGLTFNELAMNLNFTYSGISVPINLRTSDVFFPLSWRMNITLNRYPGQTGTALFNSDSQRFKMLPGHKLVINEGCKLKTPDLNVYTHFADIGPVAGTVYPTLDPAEFIVYGEYECTGNFGGRIIRGDNTPESNIVTSGSSLVTFEPYSIKDGSLIAQLKQVDEMLAISEVKTLITYSDFASKNYFAAGIIQRTSSSSLDYTSSYSTTVGTSTQTFTTNKCLLYTSDTSIKVDLINNVSTATWNDTTFVKNTSITLNESGIFEITKSTSNIGNVKVSGISLSGESKIPIGESRTFTASIDNLDVAYTKTFTWNSSNINVATVDSTGVVTALKKGATTISVTSDDGDQITNSIVVNVYDPNAAVKINYYGVVVDGVYNSDTQNGTTSTAAPGDTITLNSALPAYYGTIETTEIKWYKFTEWEISLTYSDGTIIKDSGVVEGQYTIPEDFDGESITITPKTPEYDFSYYALIISGDLEYINSSSFSNEFNGHTSLSSDITTYYFKQGTAITIEIKSGAKIIGTDKMECTLLAEGIANHNFDNSTSNNISISSSGFLHTDEYVSGTFTMPNKYVTATFKHST